MACIHLLQDTPDPKKVKILTTCVLCGKEASLTVEKHKYIQWMTGDMVQDVWPTMTPEDREILVSGTHPQCFTKYMV